MIIGGKLKFKGDFQAKLKKEEKKVRSEQEQKELFELKEEFGLNKVNNEEKQKIIKFEVKAGTGRILTSGKTVHGQGTLFQQELEPGDKMLILNPQSLVKEEQTIQVILSNKSLILEDPFEVDLVSYTAFEYQKQPKIENIDLIEDQTEQKLQNLSKKISKGKSTLEYREKKGMWGYKLIKQKLHQDATREQLLDLRTKKSRDKFCWS